MKRGLAEQQPLWADVEKLTRARRELAGRPALVPAIECWRLRTEMAAVSVGERLVLQAGDCAERFAETGQVEVRQRSAAVREVASRLGIAAHTGVVPVGRMAGQFAKPRSSASESLPGGQVLPVYRGDAVNTPEPTSAARTARAERLLDAFDASRAVLDALPVAAPSGCRAEPSPMFVAHEALLMDYELALSRPDRCGGWYGSSGHFVWLGDRTRGLAERHVAWAAEITNPIGIKVGPSAKPDEVAALSRVLDPERSSGRLTLIVRLGASLVTERLPMLVDAVARTGSPATWVCDPMHGNTMTTRSGQKIRRLDDIHAEVEGFVRTLRAAGRPPGGLHLEIAPYPVTECLAAPRWLAHTAVMPRYESACDPRLDMDQTMQVVQHFGACLRE